MKQVKFILALAVMLTLGLVCRADNDRVITVKQMPEAAQKMLKSNFNKKVPTVVTVDHDDYTIIYESGEKLEFDKKGNWKDIECYGSKVPSALIPEQIAKHVKKSYPGATIVKIERDNRHYEVTLDNGLEIEYNKKFKVVRTDKDD